MKLELDEWQKEVLGTEGNICLCSGRQVGKSTVISIKAGEYVAKNPKKTVLIIASVERQALLLFEKVLSYLHDNYKSYIKTGRDKPTKHKIILKNGSIIHCLPTGLSGYGIRGYTVDKLFADEAHFIPEEVWTAVTPMLATTGGDIILLSTPQGKEGYFYRCFNDDDFSSFHVSSEEVAEKRKEPQRTDFLHFLEKEKKRMTKLEYAQEYLGEFLGNMQQIFSDDLIKQCMVLERGKNPVVPSTDLFLGVDVAGMGEDESTFEILDGTDKENVFQIENLTTEKTRTPERIDFILTLDRQYDFNQIGIDDGGMGVGVFDFLLTDDATKRKTVSLNNASRALNSDGTKKRKLLKEEMYNNLLMMMEKGHIKLLKDPEIFLSLKSIQYNADNGKYRGTYSHIAEGLIRAAWLIKDKRLNIWIA